MTPPQAATFATEQILRDIADVKRATDAVVAQVDSLERGGAVTAGASPLPSAVEQDISLGPAQDDSLSSEEKGSRKWHTWATVPEEEIECCGSGSAAPAGFPCLVPSGASPNHGELSSRKTDPEEDVSVGLGVKFGVITLLSSRNFAQHDL